MRCAGLTTEKATFDLEAYCAVHWFLLVPKGNLDLWVELQKSSMSEITSGTVVRPLGNLMASHHRLPPNARVKINLVAQVQQVDRGATRSRRQECLMQCSRSSTCHLVLTVYYLLW